jgi:hypothetical protein
MPGEMPGGGAMPLEGRTLGVGTGIDGLGTPSDDGGAGAPGCEEGVEPGTGNGTAVIPVWVVFPRRAFRSIFAFFLSSAIGSSNLVSAHPGPGQTPLPSQGGRDVRQPPFALGKR